MDMNTLRVFTQVIERGSFTAAGKSLNMPTSTVSKRISKLEEDLGVRLLVRTTRSLSMTDAGRTFYDSCVRALGELDTVLDILSDAQATPRGVVRVHAPPEHGVTTQITNAFLHEHPEVRVEMTFSARDINIIEEGFDVAIIAGSPTNLSVVAHKLMDSPFVLVASPAYSRAHGTPRTPKELSEHACVLFSATQTHFTLDDDTKIPVRGRVAANHLLAVRDAALAGHGIALLPELACSDELRAGELVALLPAHAPSPVPLYITYPAGRYMPAAVRAYITFARSHFSGLAQKPT